MIPSNLHNRYVLGLILWALASLCSANAAETCTIETRSAPIGSGAIVYDLAGRGPAVLLLHGLFAARDQWHGLLCRFAEAGYTAIAPDLPGYGASTGYGLSAYALPAQVSLLYGLSRRLGLARFDLGGSSMGGAIAALYADRHPEQVRSLAFIGSPLGVIGWAKGVRDAIFRGINPFIPVTDAEFELELQLLFVTPPDIPAPDRRRIVAEYVRNNRHYVDVWNIANLYDDVLTRTAVPAAPSLIVWGRDDRIFDIAGAERLHRRYTASELHRLPNAGHLLLMENVDTVAPIYLRFLASSRTAP